MLDLRIARGPKLNKNLVIRKLHVLEMLELAFATPRTNSVGKLVRAYFPCYVDAIAIGEGAQTPCNRIVVPRMKAICFEVLERRFVWYKCRSSSITDFRSLFGFSLYSNQLRSPRGRYSVSTSRLYSDSVSPAPVDMGLLIGVAVAKPCKSVSLVSNTVLSSEIC
jgi:hypothetical protein